jgi:hypothetical protein
VEIGAAEAGKSLQIYQMNSVDRKTEEPAQMQGAEWIRLLPSSAEDI